MKEMPFLGTACSEYRLCRGITSLPMAADAIGCKRKREEDEKCSVCGRVPREPLSLVCGHAICPEHETPVLCPTCDKPVRKTYSRFLHENWAVERLIRIFGGHDGEVWTNKRSVYIDERELRYVDTGVPGKKRLVYLGPFDARDRRGEPHVHRHTFDYASGLEDDSPTMGIVVEIQGLQHATSEQRRQKDKIKRAWGRAFGTRVYFYQIEAYNTEVDGINRKYSKCSITEFETKFKAVLSDIKARARNDHVCLPRGTLCRPSPGS